MRLWSTWNKDCIFPPTLDPTKLTKYSMEMEKQGGFGQGKTNERQHFQHKLQMTHGMMFVMKLPPESNCHYAAGDVKF